MPVKSTVMYKPKSKFTHIEFQRKNTTDLCMLRTQIHDHSVSYKLHIVESLLVVYIYGT